MSQALYSMVGGFLGAGKTTAILKLAQALTARGLRVGLITNDQSVGLVDTRLLESHDFPVEEITGGCFCCRFNSLVEASEKLSAEAPPDVFLAEPVGSCTDLLAAVSFPLRRIYGESYRVAPLSVLVDPVRAERILGLETGPNFSRKVLYVYAKQLEEAELLLINKTDLLDRERLARLRDALAAAYPKAEILEISAREGTGIDAWIDRMLAAPGASETAPEVDYDEYADGEALLGWLNVSAMLDSEQEVDGNELLERIAARTLEGLGDAEVAHLKMTLVPDEEAGDIGVLNLVRSGGTVELSHTLREPVATGELLINLRAEADPDLLRQSVLDALAGYASAITVEHVEHFRPARPSPTHRMAHV